MKALKSKIFPALVRIASSVTIFFACKKANPNTGTSNPVIVFTRFVAEAVADLNNVPLGNARVTPIPLPFQ